MKKISSKHLLIIFVFSAFALIVLSVIGLVVLNQTNAPKDYDFITGEIKVFTVKMEVTNPKSAHVTSYTSQVQPGENILNFMKNLQEENTSFTFTYSETEYGSFITGLNGYEANSDKMEYWKLLVNNQSFEGGPTEYTLTTGDKLTWEIDHF